jgi:hypothetical protein
MTGGLSLRALAADIPHDATALFVYALLLGFVVLAWHGGRSRGTPPEGDDSGTNRHFTRRQK